MEMSSERLGTKRKMLLLAVTSGTAYSKAVGQKKANTIYFRQKGIDIKIVGDEELSGFQCELRR